MWEWRFFYRDGAAVHSVAPGLLARIETLADDGQRHVRRVLDCMQADGLLQASPKELDQLMVNSWIVSTYWIDYLRSRHAIADIRREHINWGGAQVMSLFSPFLTAAGKAQIESMLAGIGQQEQAGAWLAPRT
jgi:hypothetical protein